MQKTALFTKIYKELKPGGLFLNIDAVHPSSAHSEEIQFEMWRNWINETLEKNGKIAKLGIMTISHLYTRTILKTNQVVFGTSYRP